MSVCLSVVCLLKKYIFINWNYYRLNQFVCLPVCVSLFISYIKLLYNSAKNYSDTLRLMLIEKLNQWCTLA